MKEIFTENFKTALSSLGINDYEAEEYVIIPTDEQEKYTSMDEIYRLWVTPRFTGIRISYESVINLLVKEDKKIAPLRIKISKKENKPVLLETSQRYRKLRDIAQRKESNVIFPFEINEETELEFSDQIERIEAIRILFFNRKNSTELKELLNGKISYKEVIGNFEKHFERYRFYPPSYNHSVVGDESYSSLVINKDFKTGDFSLFINPTIDNLKIY
ncbi:MAG: hypothetical protein IPH36_14785 [Saprospiraceae bacterium]|nr:hypothetical protein [Saprospiraceae bacterium]